jgi:hypothetical protein
MNDRILSEGLVLFIHPWSFRQLEQIILHSE